VKAFPLEIPSKGEWNGLCFHVRIQNRFGKYSQRLAEYAGPSGPWHCGGHPCPCSLYSPVRFPFQKWGRDKKKKKIHLPVVRKDGGISRRRISVIPPVPRILLNIVQGHLHLKPEHVTSPQSRVGGGGHASLPQHFCHVILWHFS